MTTTPTFSRRAHLDLQQVTRALERRFQNVPPRGYVRGKTRLRNHLVDIFGVSSMRAELLVDHLHARGFIRFEGNVKRCGEGTEPWSFHTTPLCVS